MAEKDEFAVDSSVVTKWFLVESDSDLATSLRDDFATGRVRLAVPSLLFYEVMNALRFSGAFDEKDLALAGRALSKYQFGIWRPRGKLLELSAMLSLREDLSVYDACYVALAQRVRSKVITEDKELLEKFPAHTLPMRLYDPSPG
jgi:predicted nucleic acid-binding protein